MPWLCQRAVVGSGSNRPPTLPPQQPCFSPAGWRRPPSQSSCRTGTGPAAARRRRRRQQARQCPARTAWTAARAAPRAPGGCRVGVQGRGSRAAGGCSSSVHAALQRLQQLAGGGWRVATRCPPQTQHQLHAGQRKPRHTCTHTHARTHTAPAGGRAAEVEDGAHALSVHVVQQAIQRGKQVGHVLIAGGLCSGKREEGLTCGKAVQGGWSLPAAPR